MRILAAQIAHDSPRRADWLSVLGTDTVPILDPIPHAGEAPGVGRSEFYRLAVSRLDSVQHARLVAFLAARFGVTEEEVSEDLDGAHGCPILARDVTVSLDAGVVP